MCLQQYYETIEWVYQEEKVCTSFGEFYKSGSIMRGVSLFLYCY